MGTDNSPYYVAGIEDATRDACLIATCPPSPAIGYDPDREWSWMYRRGYLSVPQVPHICDKSCQRGAA